MLANAASHTVIYGWRGDRLLAPSLATRLLARVRAASLDRRLAAGADSSRSALLAARAAQLGRRRTRLALARDIEAVVLACEGHVSRFGVLPARVAIRANRAALLDLATTLRDPQAVYVRGIAAARVMLSDGSGPVYTDRHGEPLAAELRWVLGNLTSPVGVIR
jgi:hypothetical protein